VNEPAFLRTIVPRVAASSALLFCAAAATASTASAANRACAAIKASDAGVTLGGKIKTTPGATSTAFTCTYRAGRAALTVVVYKDRVTRAAFATKRTAFRGIKARGVGVPAFWRRTSGSYAVLDALKGTTWFSLRLRDPPRTKSQLQTALRGLALIAISRL